MSAPLFDPSVVPLRRSRADAMGGDYFLHERAFDDCLERLLAVNRRFERAMIFGLARPGWIERLQRQGCRDVAVVEPGRDALPVAPPDLCVSIGALDTVDALPAALAAIKHLLAPTGLFLGALAGGNSLPRLRSAMQAADRAEGGLAAAHVHPRIDAASFAALLAGAGFAEPVVDLDRVQIRYTDLDSLVRDLRGMAGTNQLLERARRPILRVGRDAARVNFSAGTIDGRTTETIEIIHFAAWT